MQRGKKFFLLFLLCFCFVLFGLIYSMRMQTTHCNPVSTLRRKKIPHVGRSYSNYLCLNGATGEKTKKKKKYCTVRHIWQSAHHRTHLESFFFLSLIYELVENSCCVSRIIERKKKVFILKFCMFGAQKSC